MKKILTFLVMLVACVSILSAQEVPAKFNYQAVVRDRNNDNNLVMEKPVTVTVEIYQGNADVAAYVKDTTITTNRNGMVSFIIGPATNVTDWTNATVKATFKDGNKVLSEVFNPIMPVPLALQAAVDPMEITTDKIVAYLNTASGQDVKRIVEALTQNADVKDAVRDSIISYIKTQDSVVKELAIYFLSTVTVDDARDAYNAITPAVKQKIKELLVDSIKANKDLAYDIIADYLKNTTKDEVKDLWSAARQNPQFHEIFDAVRDSAITYVMNHKDLMMSVAQYYIVNVLKYTDVQQIYQTLRDQNHDLYVALQNKFNDYLDSYIGDSYVKECDGITICDLKEDLANAKAKAANCPYFTDAEAIVGNPNTYRAYVAGSNSTEIKTILSVKNSNGTNVFPVGENYQWTAPSTAANLYVGEENFTTLTAGQVVVFKLEKTGCPVVEKSVTVTAQ